MPGDYVDLPIYREGLESALGFQPSDLDQNRAGRVSASQRASLVRTEAARVGATAICLLAAAGLVGVAFAVGPNSPRLLQTLGVAAALVVAAGALAWTSLNLWKDLVAGVVSSVEGLVEPGELPIEAGSAWPSAGPVYESYFWVVGDQRFRIGPKAYGALTKARHRLYFLPRTRRVMAAEPITTGL